MTKAKTKTEKKVRVKEKNVFKKNWEFLLMVLPGTLFVLVFSYLPMIGILIAFKSIDYSKGIIMSPWVGLQNFRFLFDNPDVWIILRNTIGYNLVFLTLGAVCPVAVAIMMSRMTNKRTVKVYQTMMMLPHFISWVVVSYIVYAFLSYSYGLLNTSLLPALGMEPIDWYTHKQYWPFILVFLSTWKGLGYGAVVYIAAIAGIDTSLYEAAAIDGATKWQQTRYILIPELMSVIVIMLILKIGGMFSADFGLFYNIPMERGELFPVTNVISTFVYRALKINGDIGMSSAVGFLQSVVGFVLIMLSNGIVRLIDEEKSLF